MSPNSIVAAAFALLALGGLSSNVAHAEPVNPSKVSGYDQAMAAFETRARSGLEEPRMRFIVQYSDEAVGGRSLSEPDGTVAAAPMTTDPAAAEQGWSAIRGEAAQSNVEVVERVGDLPLAVVEVSPDQLSAIAASGKVAVIQEDVLHRLHLNASGQVIQLPRAQRAGAFGAGQAVAILDTGVDADHPFFERGQVIAEACFSSTSPSVGTKSLCPGGASSSTGAGSARPCKNLSGCEHGTHVAGIAAGKLGVAPKAKIIAVQIFSAAGGSVSAFQSDIIRGLQFVLQQSNSQRIAAVNMSLGSSRTKDAVDTDLAAQCDSVPRYGLVKSRVDALAQKDIATVISAGNDSRRNEISQPACISSAITVGSTTKSDLISSFSNVSPLVDVLAPGSSICSSVPGAKFRRLDGTSMAAPQVTGAIAAVRSAFPRAPLVQVTYVLRSTGTLVRDQRSNGTYQGARINVGNAIETLRRARPSDPPLLGGNAVTRIPFGFCN